MSLPSQTLEPRMHSAVHRPDLRRVLVILGHPNAHSYCAYLGQRAAGVFSDSGHEVRSLNLHALTFDPILRTGYRGEQALEPDLQAAQDMLLWAEHWVLVYPVWWGGMPALLKGFFDRVLQPGFAFRYRKNSNVWDRLLAGRTAHLISTQDTPSWYFRWVWGRPAHNQMRHTILGFCGVKTVELREIGPIQGSSDMQRKAWADQLVTLPRRAPGANRAL